MSISSELKAAGILGGGLSLLVLAAASAQQAVLPPPAAVHTKVPGVTQRVPVTVPRPASEGGGWTTEYREMQYTVMTPELAQLQTEEVQAASEAQSLAAQVAKASEPHREELKGKLRESLARQFDAQQKRRSQEIEGIEDRLAKLKETLQKRGAAKEAIIGRRLDQLTGVKDELAWEETGPALEPRYGTIIAPAYPGASPFAIPPNVPRAVTPVPGWAPGNPVPIPTLNPPSATEAPPSLHPAASGVFGTATPPPPPTGSGFGTVVPQAAPAPSAPPAAPAPAPSPAAASGTAPAASPAPAAPEPPRLPPAPNRDA
jgi:hypothetical protein